MNAERHGLAALINAEQGIQPNMKMDEQFYRNMLSHESGAEIGIALAASSVYAAKYGACEPEDKTRVEYKIIMRTLREKYKGRNLSVNETITEMDTVKSDTRQVVPQDK
jgi:hypothetical protein